MMKRFRTILAFGCGCATATLLAWAVPMVDAQGGADTSDAIHVCIAADGVLRLFELSAACPAGQRSLLVKKKTLDSDAPKPTPEEKTRDANSGSTCQAALDTLERRLNALENSPDRRFVGNRIVAPFEVVDQAGKRVFLVAAEGGPPRAELYNDDGKAVATVTAGRFGGQFVGRASASRLSVNVGIYAEGKSAGMAVVEGDDSRVLLGKDDNTGKYSLRFYGSGGALIAGLGQNATNGAGLAVLRDAAGKPRVNMGIGAGELEGKGFVEIVNDNDMPLARLSEGDHAGGLLRINGANREPMVEAGVTNEAIGVVRAGPASFKPGMGLFGLPGSYISGRAK